jgi:DNA-directed RNA polymerase subunit RPC12/RpoP
MTIGCKSCRSREIYSVESIEGTCAGTILDNGEWEPGGYTEVAWDSAETTGYGCATCGEEASTLAELLVEWSDGDDETCACGKKLDEHGEHEGGYGAFCG